MAVHSRLIRSVIAAYLLMSLLLGASVAQTRQSTKARDAATKGPPINADLILHFLRTRVKAEVLIDIIRTRKLDFIATEEIMKKLEQAGASEAVLAAVRESARPEPVKVTPAPPPPPPAAPKTGTLSVNCAPAECSVMIDAAPGESTAGGALKKTLIAGKHTVTVNKPGYGGKHESVELTADGYTINATLQPDAATMGNFGGMFAKKMLDAMGDDGIDVRGSGSWTVQRADATPAEWTFAAHFGPSESSFAIQKTPEGVYEIACRGQSCQARKPALLKGKAVKPADQGSLDTDLKLFRRFYIANLIPMWRAGLGQALIAQAQTDQPVEDRYRFRLTGADDVYDVELDRGFQPVQVSYTSKLVGGTPTVVSYASYTPVGKFKYPKQMTLKPPEQAARAIQVRMDVLEPGKAP